MTRIGDEDLLIAVANTAHTESDELADGEAVNLWWYAASDSTNRTTKSPPSPPSSEQTVAMLRTLRSVIRGLALRNNGIEPDPVDTSALDALPLKVDLDPHPSLRTDPPGDLAQDIAAATVAALLRATARPGWPRVKACRGDDCRWVFIDGSRNSSRRWCAMSNCGNRAKVAAFRDRHRTA